MSSIALVHAACRDVLRECPDGYAKTYARAALSQNDEEALRVQCLYVLSNTGQWRGDTARKAKAVLREYSKALT